MQSRNFILPIISSTLLFIILMAMSFHSPAQTNDKIVTTYQKSQIQHKYGLDPATSLPTRIRETPAGVVKMFEDAGMSPRQHQLSSAELLKVEKAFAILPPLHQRVLKEHLRSISFLDNMPNTALIQMMHTRFMILLSGRKYFGKTSPNGSPKKRVPVSMLKGLL
jgi:hypothetical protein